MPGERLAKLSLRIENILPNLPSTIPGATVWGYLRLRLAGTWVRFTPSTRNFRTVGAEDNYEYSYFPESSRPLPQQIDLLLATIRQAIADRLLAYTVSARRSDGTTPTGTELYAFDILAGVYDRNYDLAWQLVSPMPIYRPTFSELVNLPTIRPVRAYYLVNDALVFNSPTGTITLSAYNGNDGVYAYAWDDFGAPATAVRTNVRNGLYTCTITDTSGAYLVQQVVVGSDPRLEVRAERVENDVTLVVSGGLAPYTYAWSDGPTTAVRLALGVGTYTATVTDARGATQQVEVTIDPYRYYWSKNPVTLRVDAGAAYRADPTTKPNLSFLCEVWVEEVYLSNAFVRLGGTQEQPADADGRTVFDAQALLDGYLQAHLPELNQAQPSRADALFRRFYFRYAEKFGTPPVAAALSSQVRHYVLLGGLDFYEAEAGRWRDYQAAVKPFLTWEPNNKTVLPSQPEYLYFMPDSLTLSRFQVQVLIGYTDGTTAQRLAATVLHVQRFEVYCLPAGYRALGLAPVAASTGPAVAWWEVWVSDAAGVAQTERRRYVLDARYVAKPRFFLYTNSLGGTSTLAATGQGKTALEVKTDEADRPLSTGYEPLLGSVLELDRFGTPTLSVATGPLSAAQLVTLQDLLLSGRVTLQSGDTYFAGRIKAKAVPLRDEAPGELESAEFDFVMPVQRQFNPRLPAVATTAVRGGEGAQP